MPDTRLMAAARKAIKQVGRCALYGPHDAAREALEALDAALAAEEQRLEALAGLVDAAQCECKRIIAAEEVESVDWQRLAEMVWEKLDAALARLEEVQGK